MTSRRIDTLHPLVAARAKKFLLDCCSAGIDVIVTATLRTNADQNALYDQGRTKPGKIVTRVSGGNSYHNWGLAFDIVPLRDGKPVWGTSSKEDKALWTTVGNIGVKCGLEWGGNWVSFKDYPHFQYTCGHDISFFKNGNHL
jgi:peptidoglycan LD-endopeptidase CwlK